MLKENSVREKQYFTGLTGLRGIFCMGIVIYHVGGVFHFAFSQWLDPIYTYGGYFGNYMFFVISGFLISWGYQKKIRAKEYTFIEFMTKHGIKIYPAYIISNLVMAVVGSSPLTAKRSCITLLMGYGWISGETMPYNFPTWFLCILLICYGMYYGVVAVSRKYPRAYVPLCAAFVIWGMLLELCGWTVPMSYRTCGEGYMNFFLGIILAEALLAEKRNVIPIKAISFILLFTTVPAMCLCGLDHLPGDMRWWISLLCVSLTSLAVHKGWVEKVLSCCFLQMIGAYSREMFLWHIPVVWTFLHFVPQDNSGTAFLLYLLILVAFITLLHYVEKKCKWRLPLP